MTATQLERRRTSLLAEPHHDGSDAYVLERPDELGGEAVVRAPRAERRGRRRGRAPLRPGRRAALGRAPRSTARRRRTTWWRASFPVGTRHVRTAGSSSGGEVGYDVGERPRASSRTTSPDADDFVLAARRRARTGTSRRSSTRSSPTASRPRRRRRRRARLGGRRARGTSCRPGRGPSTPRELFGGDLRGIEQRLDHIEPLGANALYLTPIFPAGQHAPLRRDELRPRRPAARRRRGARARCSRAAHARGMRVARRPDARTTPATRTSGSSRRSPTPTRPSASSTTSTTRSRTATRSWLGHPDACRSSTGARPSSARGCVGRAARWLERRRSTAGGSTSRT